MIEFPIEGFSLSPAEERDRGYFLSCMKKDILNSVSDFEKGFSETWMDDSMLFAENSFDKRPLNDEMFILRENEKRIGLIWLNVSRDQFTMEHIGYVMGLYVEPEYRRRGLGKALIGFAEKWSREKGFMMLSLNVGSPNSSAERFYEGMGFSVQSKVMRKFLM